MMVPASIGARLTAGSAPSASEPGWALAARHADLRTTTIYDRRRENFDRHVAYVVVAFVAGG